MNIYIKSESNPHIPQQLFGNTVIVTFKQIKFHFYETHVKEVYTFSNYSVNSAPYFHANVLDSDTSNMKSNLLVMKHM